MIRELNMEQDFLPNFLKADAEAREAMITEEERQVHLARQFCRFERAQKLCKNEQMRQMLQRCKMQTIKLMQRS